MCSTGGQNSKSHQYSCRENPTNGMKRQRDMIPEEEAPRSEGIQNATGEEQRAITISSSKNEEAGTKLKWHLVVDVFGDGSEVGCRKEQYCIGTWNDRSMNQDKFEVVKMLMFTLANCCLTTSFYLDSWTKHSRFLCNTVLYSIGLYFHHQTYPRLGRVSVLAQTLHYDLSVLGGPAGYGS